MTLLYNSIIFGFAKMRTLTRSITPSIYNYIWGTTERNLTERRNRGLSLTGLTHCISL